MASGMDFSLNSDQILIRDTVRQFMEAEMRPILREYEREDKFPAEQIRKLGELGCCGMLVPEEWGGAGTDTVSYAVMLEEVARVCASTAVAMSVTNSVAAAGVEARHRGAEKKIFDAAFARGNSWRVLPDRAGGGLGCGRDSDAGGALRRFLLAQRDEKLGDERRRIWGLYRVCENGSRRGREGHDGVFGRADFPGFRVAVTKIRWGCTCRNRRKLF